MKYTVAQMKQMNKRWFGKEEMAFFGTKIHTKGTNEYGLFITSEQPPHGERKFSLRLFVEKTADVITVGNFCQMDEVHARYYHDSLTKAFKTMGFREKNILDNLAVAKEWDGSPHDCLMFVSKEIDFNSFVVRITDSKIVQ